MGSCARARARCVDRDATCVLGGPESVRVVLNSSSSTVLSATPASIVIVAPVLGLRRLC